MRKKKQTIQVADGISPELLASLQGSTSQRRWWVLEILLSIAIVVALLLGGMVAYKHFHRSNEPHSVPKSNAQHVVQPPLQNTDAETPTSKPAATTPASGSTNNGSVTQPQ